MTNGEKIQEIFLDIKIITQYDNPFGDRFMVFTLNNKVMQVNLDWWNAEYKEPTTKNDLGIDCISRTDAIRVASGYCHPSNVAKELAKLPSMGRYDPYTDKFIKE